MRLRASPRRMSSAKDLRLAPIASSLARKVITRLHYSGTVVSNSQLHLGVFHEGKVRGVLSFGPPLDRSKMLGLVSGTRWNGMCELNRMALAEELPRNSESRTMAVAFRILRQRVPSLEWVVSFADASQCGDGTIYRAAGFVLTGIKQNSNLVRRGDGAVIHKMTLESSPTSPRPELGGRSYYDVTGGRYDLAAYAAACGGSIVPGYQLRYIYFLNRAARDRLTVPEIPYSAIPDAARMYRGKRARSSEVLRPSLQTGEGGSTPTRALLPSLPNNGGSDVV